MTVFRWPKPGEPDIFTAGSEKPMTNARVNMYHDNFEALSLGYHEAAEALVEKVIREERRQDLLVYPILFLYRHHFELRLKETIRLCSHLLDLPFREPKTHKLLDLWNIARPLIRKVEPKGPVDVLDGVEEVLKRFHEYDPMSESFRYSRDMKGKNPLKGVRYVNLARVHRVLGGLATFFESISGMLNEYFTAMCEAESSG